jgi:D-alanine-D-alanine ligase
MTSRRFKKVGVLMGGPSSEREVSLRSGAAVANALRTVGYDVVEIDVTDRSLDVPAGVEAVFVALHGEFGEDGGIQALLQAKGVPYTGSGPESSRRAFDKLLSKQVFINHDIPTPAFEVLVAGQARTLPLPVVVKPVRQGSSIGVHIVLQEQDWPAALKDAVTFDGQVLVESFIEGRELTVGVVGDQVLPVLEIRAPQGFYNYKAKYTKGATEYLVPAPIPEERAKACRELAGRVFGALGCEGMGRVDFRMTPAGKLFVLELNNIPGFTETSLLPKAARVAGIEFPELCDRILKMASVH